jgi:hypothetical protein
MNMPSIRHLQGYALLGLAAWTASPAVSLPTREDTALQPLPPLGSVLSTLPLEAAQAPAQEDSLSSTTRTRGADGDTLSLPDLEVRGRRGDSVSREFRAYWAEYEKREGFDELRNQVRAHNNIDLTWVPRLYLFDSSLVIFPGWVVWRRKPGR